MFNLDVLPFKTTPSTTSLFKPLETTSEVKTSSSGVFTSYFVIKWASLLKEKTRGIEYLETLKSMPLMFNSSNSDLSIVFDTLVYDIPFFNKTVEIFNKDLDTFLKLNSKLPQGFFELKGKTLIKDVPRPFSRVYLLLAKDGTCLASVLSDIEGNFKFENVRENFRYITLASDPLKEYSSTSQEVKAK